MVAVWQEEEAQRHVCGTYRWEWEEGTYVAEIEACPYCAKADEMHEQMVEEHDREVIRGWGVVLVDGRFADGE